jgi:hypothetical protein
MGEIRLGKQTEEAGSMTHGELLPANTKDARAWFSNYHYTKTVGGYLFYKWVRDGITDGIVAFGRGGNRFGVSGKFGLIEFNKGLEITRVACHPNAPRNTASQMVAAATRELAACGHHWVFTYADTAHGHHGGIYQALNAVYVGTDAKQWVNFELDGLRVSKRMISGKFGHTRWPDVKELAAKAGHKLRKVAWQPKHTYVLVISKDRKIRRAIQAKLKLVSLPYPKRGDAVIPTPYRNHVPKMAEQDIEA